MNREHWKAMLPFVTAFANGEELLFDGMKAGQEINFASDVNCYRIKPKPTYRPFANAAEFMPHANRFMTVNTSYGTPSAEWYRANVINDTMMWFDGASRTAHKWDKLLRDYVFEDGTPCGVKVE